MKKLLSVSLFSLAFTFSASAADTVFQDWSLIFQPRARPLFTAEPTVVPSAPSEIAPPELDIPDIPAIEPPPSTDTVFSSEPDIWQTIPTEATPKSGFFSGLLGKATIIAGATATALLGWKAYQLRQKRISAQRAETTQKAQSQMEREEAQKLKAEIRKENQGEAPRIATQAQEEEKEALEAASETPSPMEGSRIADTQQIEDPQRIGAATTLQASWRGSKSRKLTKEQLPQLQAAKQIREADRARYNQMIQRTTQSTQEWPQAQHGEIIDYYARQLEKELAVVEPVD